MFPKFLERFQTLGTALDEMVRHYPRREVLVLGDRRVTLRELGQRVDALAAAWRELGIGREDKVAIILPNCVEFVYAAFAAAKIGAAAVPMSTQLRAREIEQILTDCEAVAVVTDVRAGNNLLLAELAKLRPSLPALRHVIYRGSLEDAPPEAQSGVISLETQLRTAPVGGTSRSPLPPVVVDPADAAVILYTSGTTGIPKGAVLSHRILMMGVKGIGSKFTSEMGLSWPMIKRLPQHLKTIRRLPWLVEAILAGSARAQIKFLVLTPFYHITGYSQVLLGILGGHKLVVLDRFHPDKALNLIQQERVTVIVAVPPMYQAMLSRPDFDRRDLSSVIIMLTTAMATPPELVEELHRRVGGFVVIIYGSTEIGAATMTLPSDDPEKQARTVGRAPKGDIQVRIVDAQRRELPVGAEGEIAVWTPAHMEGYYKRPDATDEALDKDGWYYTGDMGMMDAGGYVKVLGRRGDMINRAGVNIYPAEIENFLMTHPAIAKAAVVGVPGPLSSGERVLAYVVPKGGATIEPSQVLAYCWGQIASFKVPDEVVVVGELPVTSALQKVQHFKLRQQARGGNGRGASAQPPAGTDEGAAPSRDTAPPVGAASS